MDSRSSSGRRDLARMTTYRGLKAWEHARRLAVECSKASRRLPKVEQPALGAELRRAGYTLVLRIAGASASQGPARQAALEEARTALAEIDTILCIGHDLEYIPTREFARLEAWAAETGKVLYGLFRTTVKSLRPSVPTAPAPAPSDASRT